MDCFWICEWFEIWFRRRLYDDSDLDVPDGPVRAQRHADMTAAFNLAIGIVIGPGMLIGPKEILRNSGSIALTIFIWCLSGLWSFAGATCLSELGTTIPGCAGDSFYVKLAYGKMAGFVHVWVTCLIILPTSMAVAALTLARYVLEPACRPNEIAVRLVAFCAISGICYVNIKNVKSSLKLQKWFTHGKVFVVFTIIFLAIYNSLKGETTAQVRVDDQYGTFWRGTNTNPHDLALALTIGYYTFAGCNSITYITEEMRHPEVYFPKAMRYTVFITIFLYMVASLGYFATLTKSQIMKTDFILIALAGEVIGSKWGEIVGPLLVTISMLGSLNAMIFTGARMMVSASRQDNLYWIARCIHYKNRTPAPAVVILVLLSSAYLVTTKIMTLIWYLVLADAFSTVVTISTVLWLRFKYPELERPFRVRCYLPIFFIAITILIFALPLCNGYHVEALIALNLILLGIPVYYLSAGWHFKPRFLARWSHCFAVLLQMFAFSVESDPGIEYDIISTSTDASSEETDDGRPFIDPSIKPKDRWYNAGIDEADLSEEDFGFPPLSSEDGDNQSQEAKIVIEIFEDDQGKHYNHNHHQAVVQMGSDDGGDECELDKFEKKRAKVMTKKKKKNKYGYWVEEFEECEEAKREIKLMIEGKELQEKDGERNEKKKKGEEMEKKEKKKKKKKGRRQIKRERLEAKKLIKRLSKRARRQRWAQARDNDREDDQRLVQMRASYKLFLAHVSRKTLW